MQASKIAIVHRLNNNGSYTRLRVALAAPLLLSPSPLVLREKRSRLGVGCGCELCLDSSGLGASVADLAP